MCESTEVNHGVIAASIIRAECQRGKNDVGGAGTGRRAGSNLRKWHWVEPRRSLRGLCFKVDALQPRGPTCAPGIA